MLPVSAYAVYTYVYLKQSRLTEGVPLVLPYGLGNVVGEVFGYRCRGVMILDVGAPYNGPCKEKNIVNIPSSQPTENKTRLLSKIPITDHIIKLEKSFLLLLKYPDNGN